MGMQTPCVTMTAMQSRNVNTNQAPECVVWAWNAILSRNFSCVTFIVLGAITVETIYGGSGGFVKAMNSGKDLTTSVEDKVCWRRRRMKMRMMRKKKKKKNVFAKLNRIFHLITPAFKSRRYTNTHKHNALNQQQLDGTRLFPLCLTEFFVKVVMSLGFGIKILNPIYR